MASFSRLDVYKAMKAAPMVPVFYHADLVVAKEVVKACYARGVQPTEENWTAWFQAGVSCVEIGSNLFPKAVIEAKDWSKLTAMSKEAFAIINQVRTPK